MTEPMKTETEETEESEAIAFDLGLHIHRLLMDEPSVGLAPKIVNTIFEKSYTNYLMENHFQKKHNSGKMLWTLFTLENWYNNNGYPDKKL